MATRRELIVRSGIVASASLLTISVTGCGGQSKGSPAKVEPTPSATEGEVDGPFTFVSTYIGPWSVAWDKGLHGRWGADDNAQWLFVYLDDDKVDSRQVSWSDDRTGDFTLSTFASFVNAEIDSGVGRRSPVPFDVPSQLVSSEDNRIASLSLFNAGSEEAISFKDYRFIREGVYLYIRSTFLSEDDYRRCEEDLVKLVQNTQILGDGVPWE